MNGADQRIVITDLRIPFWRLVVFFIKASLAAIPAAIVVAIIIMIITALVAGLLGGSMGFMMNRWSM
jgi:hypothetical protein